MATVARTVAVNAAFLQEIKEDNQQLRDVLAHTASLLRQPCCERAQLRLWADALDELRDQLAMHFALEDAYGYFEDAVTQSPRLCQQAETLHGQHAELFAEACELAELADQLLHERHASPQIRQLSQSFRMFHDRFCKHEHRENELIMAAFEDDIGVGD